MNIIHGAWVPEGPRDFIQSGHFYLWVESDEVSSRLKNPAHPQHLQGQSCLDSLKNELAVSPVKEQGTVISLGLPTYQDRWGPANNSPMTSNAGNNGNKNCWEARSRREVL